MTEIYDVLRLLGIIGRFLGCRRAALAIQIAINNPDAYKGNLLCRSKGGRMQLAGGGAESADSGFARVEKEP